MASKALDRWTKEDNRKMNEWKRKSRQAMEAANTPEELLKALKLNCTTMQRVRTWLQGILWMIEDNEISQEHVAREELYRQTFALAS